MKTDRIRITLAGLLALDPQRELDELVDEHAARRVLHLVDAITTATAELRAIAGLVPTAPIDSLTLDQLEQKALLLGVQLIERRQGRGS